MRAGFVSNIDSSSGMVVVLLLCLNIAGKGQWSGFGKWKNNVWEAVHVSLTALLVYSKCFEGKAVLAAKSFHHISRFAVFIMDTLLWLG